MLISEYTRVLNKLGFWTFQGYTRFSIQYLVTRAWQYSEGVWICHCSKYAKVRYKFVNKILHHRYLTGFWICLEFWICLCYTGFWRKQPVIHVWQVSEWALNMLGLTYTMVVNMPGMHMVLCKLYFKDPQYWMF